MKPDNLEREISKMPSGATKTFAANTPIAMHSIYLMLKQQALDGHIDIVNVVKDEKSQRTYPVSITITKR